MPDAPIRQRYEGEADLTPLLDFASRSLAERLPLGAIWHPGDIIWELRGQYGSRQPIGYWRQDGTVAALAWFVGPGQLWLEAIPSGEALVGEAVSWAEASMRRDQGGETPSLMIRASHGDHRRIERLEALGYALTGPESVQFELDLGGDLPEAALPTGFMLGDCVGVDAEQRAAAHRHAWSDLRHIGIENAKSGFSAATYQTIRQAPVYRPDLDLAVWSPEGACVATCICWADPVSGVGVFEPMGTDPAFRGRGLARALVAEGLRRLRATGHSRARIGTAHFNSSAIAAYSALFNPLGRSYWWAKVL